MKTIKIDIIHPKAEELLHNLADLQLINISEPEENIVHLSSEQKEMLIMSEKDIEYDNFRKRIRRNRQSMASMKVFWTRTAISQRNLVFQYWNERNRSNEYSIKLHMAIKERTHLLKNYPLIGKKTDYKDIRMVPLRHYSILYKIEESRILIMAFWDNRQNPRKLLRLLRENN